MCKEQRALLNPKAPEASTEPSTMNGKAINDIADAHVSAWRAIDAALSPIIGKNGVAALFRRAVDLSRAHFRWLRMTQAGDVPDDWIGALATALSKQQPQEATAANDEILQRFGDLLGKLIGESLADRLLQSTCHTSSSTKTSQDSWTP